jgi:hypothetical protein
MSGILPPSGAPLMAGRRNLTKDSISRAIGVTGLRGCVDPGEGHDDAYFLALSSTLLSSGSKQCVATRGETDPARRKRKRDIDISVEGGTS